MFAKPDDSEIELFGISTPIPEFDKSLIADLCTEMLEKHRPTSPVRDLEPPLVVIGDIHGNIHDLLRILIEVPVYQHKCVFLGDYVDRGSYSLDVITLLFALKLQYPENVVLLRGNHEFRSTNSVYGFQKEIQERYHSDDLWNKFNEVFDYMPIAADVAGKILLVHGGICPKLRDIQTLRNLTLPIETYDSELVSDLMWSDPIDKAITYVDNERGKGKMFGSKAFSKFLRATQYKAVIRGHQCVTSGIQSLFSNHLWTVFSTSCYGAYTNNAGILKIDADYNVVPVIWPARRYIGRTDARFCKACPCEIPRSGSVTTGQLSLLATRQLRQGSVDNLLAKGRGTRPRFHKSASVRITPNRSLGGGDSVLPSLRASDDSDRVTLPVRATMQTQQLCPISE